MHTKKQLSLEVLAVIDDLGIHYFTSRITVDADDVECYLFIPF